MGKYAQKSSEIKKNTHKKESLILGNPFENLFFLGGIMRPEKLHKSYKVSSEKM